MKKTTTAMLVSGALACAALGGGASLDPEEKAGRPAQQGAAASGRDQAASPRARERAARSERLVDREAMRARLVQRLEDATALRDGIQELLDKLDAGAPIGEVVRESEQLRGAARELAATPARARDAAGQRETREAAAPEEAARPRIQEQRQRAMKFLEENMPAFAERLRNLKDRRMAESALSKVAPRLDELERSRKETPEQFPLRLQELRMGIIMVEQARQLSLEAAKAEPNQRQIDRLEAEIGTLAANMFDVRTQLQALEIKAIEERVETSRRELERMKNNRDRLVEERVRSLVRRAKNAGVQRDSAHDARPGDDGAR